MKVLLFSIIILLLSGCSVFGESVVEIAPYDVIENTDQARIEVRNYPHMILVSTRMDGDNRNGAFRRLFQYISGDNVAALEIAMTAPVFMDQDQNQNGVEISMTAPVFMDAEGLAPLMSFVMPAEFTLQNTPVPTSEAVKVHEIKDYQVAVITFNGRLSNSNIEKHRNMLEQWIVDRGYVITGGAKSAGYDAPFTLAPLRRNEVLIPVAKR